MFQQCAPTRLKKLLRLTYAATRLNCIPGGLVALLSEAVKE